MQQVVKSVNMRLGISGELVYHDANGNVIGTCAFKGSVPLTDEPTESPTTGAQASESPLEQSHGTDHR